jgi:SAM-dependent methyltransferase
MQCPLCNNDEQNVSIQGPDIRLYCLCNQCNLVFTTKENFLSPAEEKQRYSYHQNTIEDAGYVSFLYKAITPALRYLKTNAVGLDYGCGPTPTLSKLLLKEGFVCNDYDPYFFPELKEDITYDFIFATECFEHFFQPEKELQKTSSLLNENGLLIIMTEHWQTESHFANWYYPKDPTHVCFYNSKTFNFIALKFGFILLHNDLKRVIILKKQ